MYVGLFIGEQIFVLEAYVVRCATCFAFLTAFLDGRKLTDKEMIDALEKEGAIHLSARPCNRHPQQGGRRNV